MSHNKPIEVKQARKKKYTEQDVRNEALEVRDELLANIEFLKDIIREDRIKLQRYHERFGDLKYRPIVREDPSIGPQYGNPTEVNLEPLASSYRATINSLLQSVRLIQSEILPEDNPEGQTTAKSQKDDSVVDSKRSSLRDQFRAEAQTRAAVEPDDSDEELPIQLVETPKPTTKLSNASTTKSKPTSEPVSKPWRSQPQSKFVPSTNVPDVVKEPKRGVVLENKPMTNPAIQDEATERMKQELKGMMGTSSRMSMLAEKYGKKKQE